MRHGEKKETFETGAQRDTAAGKGRPSLIVWEAIRRTGIHLGDAAKHYGDDNWRAGMPFRRVIDSLIRHIFQYADCDSEEDHLAAIICNATFLMQYEKDHPELDDRYRYPEKITPRPLTSDEPPPTVKRRGQRLPPSVHDFSTKCRDCGKVVPKTEGCERCISCEMVEREGSPCLGGCGKKVPRDFARCTECTAAGRF